MSLLLAEQFSPGNKLPDIVVFCSISCAVFMMNTNAETLYVYQSIY